MLQISETGLENQDADFNFSISVKSCQRNGCLP